MERLHSNLSDEEISLEDMVKFEQETIERLIQLNHEKPFEDFEHYIKLLSYHSGKRNELELRIIDQKKRENRERHTKIVEFVRQSNHRIIEGANCLTD